MKKLSVAMMAISCLAIVISIQGWGHAWHERFVAAFRIDLPKQTLSEIDQREVQYQVTKRIHDLNRKIYTAEIHGDYAATVAAQHKLSEAKEAARHFGYNDSFVALCADGTYPGNMEGVAVCADGSNPQ